MRLTRTLQAAVLLCLTAPCAVATTYYVSPTGDDANAGTQAYPFRSIGWAVTVSQTGDTVLVLDGTYTGNINRELFATSAGAARNITLKSVNGPAACIIDAQGQGRAFVIQKGETAACRIEGFTVKNGKGLNQTGDGPGGAVYIYNSSPTFVKCVITNNAAKQAGGAVYAQNSSATFVDCTFGNNAVTNNTATDNFAAGGGLYIVNSNVALTGCTIRENTASYPDGRAVGAGIALVETQAVLDRCSISANTLPRGVKDSRGAGMYVEKGSISMTACTVAGNIIENPQQLSIGGGIMLSECTANISDSLIDSNTLNISEQPSQDGGGGVFLLSTSSVTLNRCVISNNKVQAGTSPWGGAGGGIRNFQGSITLNNCALTGNSVNVPNAGSGGGYFGVTASINSCVITGNSVTSPYPRAGGLTISGGQVVNTIIAGNTIAGGGDASAMATTSGTLVTNCTITGNTGPSGPYASVILVGLDAHTFRNNIIYGNSPSPVFRSQEGGSAIVTYSDIEGGYAGTGNINADPQFVDAASGNYRLKPTSPCIDKGTNTGAPATDYDGNPRPFGSAVDIGAFEWVLKELYVHATTGNDNNPGTAAAPFKTMTKAVQAAGNGYTIHVAGGDYPQDVDTNKALDIVLWNGGIADIGTR